MLIENIYNGHGNIDNDSLSKKIDEFLLDKNQEFYDFVIEDAYNESIMSTIDRDRNKYTAIMYQWNQKHVTDETQYLCAYYFDDKDDRIPDKILHETRIKTLRNAQIPNTTNRTVDRKDRIEPVTIDEAKKYILSNSTEYNISWVVAEINADITSTYSLAYILHHLGLIPRNELIVIADNFPEHYGKDITELHNANKIRVFDAFPLNHSSINNPGIKTDILPLYITTTNTNKDQSSELSIVKSDITDKELIEKYQIILQSLIRYYIEENYYLLVFSISKMISTKSYTLAIYRDPNKLIDYYQTLGSPFIDEKDIEFFHQFAKVATFLSKTRKNTIKIEPMFIHQLISNDISCSNLYSQIFFKIDEIYRIWRLSTNLRFGNVTISSTWKTDNFIHYALDDPITGEDLSPYTTHSLPRNELYDIPKNMELDEFIKLAEKLKPQLGIDRLLQARSNGLNIRDIVGDDEPYNKLYV